MTVRIAWHGEHVAVITLDAPERLNALDEQAGRELRALCRELSSEVRLRCVVLTGTPPAFSAGGDLDFLESLIDEAKKLGPEHVADFMHHYYLRFTEILDLPVPVVGAINGHAVGAGLCLALLCDLRIVSREARLGVNFARLGLFPGLAATWFLPRAVGMQQAAKWFYTGELVTGEVAVAAGFGLEALDSSEVLPRSLALAEQIALSSPSVVRQLRRHLPTVMTSPLDEILRREADGQGKSYETGDLREGIAALRERRDPRH